MSLMDIFKKKEHVEGEQEAVKQAMHESEDEYKKIYLAEVKRITKEKFLKKAKTEAGKRHNEVKQLEGMFQSMGKQWGMN